MCKTLLSVLSLLLLSACAQGYMEETKTTPALYSSGLPPITTLHIAENAKTPTGHSAADTQHCKDFRITQAQALAYFNSAKITHASDDNISPCFAQGDMTLAFEGAARWTINEDGSAILTKQNGTELRLFCPDCILGHVP